MHIAILSDTHGRIGPLERALALIAERDISHIIHCGDLDEADIVATFPRGTNFVWGNCDHDRGGIGRAIEQVGGIMHGAWGQLDLAGHSLAFTHGDDKHLLQDLENADTFDYVFYGHTHVAREHRVGKTRVINPGALHRASPKTFVILNVTTGELESFEVG